MFDAVIANIAGAARIDLNARGATPTAQAQFTATSFPFADIKQRDPVSGVEEGALENPRARDHQPKIFYTNTGVEYWGGGRSAALVHTAPDGSKDLTLPDNERFYFLTGSQHGPAKFPSSVTNGQQKENPNDYWFTLRALMVAMDKWVRDRVAPPASRYPRLADGTLVRAADVAFPNVPTVTSPRSLTAGSPRPESPDREGRRARDAAAAPRASGRSGRQRAGRHPPARHRRPARDLYRLEFPEAGHRRAESAVPADGLVRGVSGDEERARARRRIRVCRSKSATRHAIATSRSCRKWPPRS